MFNVHLIKPLTVIVAMALLLRSTIAAQQNEYSDAAIETSNVARGPTKTSLRPETVMRLGRASTGHFGGQALVLSGGPAAHGSEVILDATFHCDSGSAPIFDPFLSWGDPWRAVLRVFDDNDVFVANVLTETPLNMPVRQMWVRINDGTVIGRRVAIKTSNRTAYANLEGAAAGDGAALKCLGPGRYKAQLVFLGRFLDHHIDGGYRPRPTLDDPCVEICRSKVCNFEVALPNGTNNDGRRLANSAPLLGVLSIRSSYRSDNDIEFEACLINAGVDAVAVLNPFFDILVPIRTAQLVLTKEDGAMLGVVWDTGPHDGSNTLVASHWVVLPPSSIAGRVMRGDFGSLSLIATSPPQAKLQMVYFDTVASSPPNVLNSPAANIEVWNDWKRRYPGKESFRSNRVSPLFRK